jgi:hypothetical protein
MRRLSFTQLVLVLLSLTTTGVYCQTEDVSNNGIEMEEPTEEGDLYGELGIDTKEATNDRADLEAEEAEDVDDALPRSFFETKIEPIPYTITYDYLKHNITDFHSHVKNCLDQHFQTPAESQVELKFIIQDCAGERGVRLTKYYNDIKFLTKKKFYDEMKKTFKKGYCDEDINICLEYFRAVQLFVELNYDVGESLNVNFQDLEKLMTLPKLKLFNGLFSENLEEYNNIKVELKKAQSFLLQLFRNRREQYAQEFEEEEVDDGTIEIMGQKIDKDGNIVEPAPIEINDESDEDSDPEEQADRKKVHSLIRHYTKQDEEKDNEEEEGGGDKKEEGKEKKNEEKEEKAGE